MSSFVGRLSKLLGNPARSISKPDYRFRPRVDALEDRRLLAVFIVDDDFTDNPAARQYDTIQEAVDAAATPVGSRPGDIIVVRPGLYDENVVVDKRLTLIGSFAPSLPYIGATPNAYDPAINPNIAAIIDPTTAGAALTITASGAVVQGFTIANFEGTADSNGVVIGGETTGVRVMRNVILDQTIGIYLNTSDATNNVGAAQQTWIYGNTFRDNNTAGAAAGNGIYADAGVRNVLISANTFTGHENASIIIISDAVDTVNTNVTITANRIGDQFADLNDSSIILANLENSTVSYNILRNIYNNGTGIFFAGGSSNVTVIGNNLQDGAFTGINVRYLPEFYFVDSPNTRLFIQGNIVSNFGDGGIRLRDGSFENIVRLNTVYNNGFGATGEDADDGFGSGITLEGAIDNIVDSNTSYNNDTDGFFADAASLDNVLRNNYAFGNGEHDFHDDSVSETNPSLTANIYLNNRGRTQNRPGLIRFFV